MPRYLLAVTLALAACEETRGGAANSPAPPPPAGTPTEPVPVDLEGLTTWEAGYAVSSIGQLGDVDDDGHADFDVSGLSTADAHYLVLGNAELPRDLRADAVAFPVGEVWSTGPDVNGDGREDFGRGPWDAPEFVDGPISPLTTEAILAAPTSSTLPSWATGFYPIEGRTAFVGHAVAEDVFALVPGPAQNWSVGTGALEISWSAVNPDPARCDWTTIAPAIRSLGDIDTDGDLDLGLFPFGSYSDWCDYHVGYLVPEPLPTSATFDLTNGMAGWATFGDMRAVPDQTGDGINDVLLRSHPDYWHLVAGPVVIGNGVLEHGQDYGVVPAEYVSGTPVPDVTGDGQQDWLVQAQSAGVNAFVLRSGGTDAMFASDPVVLAAWTNDRLIGGFTPAGNFVVSGDLVLFPTGTGVAVVNLLTAVE